MQGPAVAHQWQTMAGKNDSAQAWGQPCLISQDRVDLTCRQNRTLMLGMLELPLAFAVGHNSNSSCETTIYPAHEGNLGEPAWQIHKPNTL